MSDALPDQIVEAIAISNAKSIGEQPAILANLALSNQILNNNLQQQMAIGQQAAINQVTLATMSRCVALIAGDDKQGVAGEVMNLLNGLLTKTPVDPQVDPKVDPSAADDPSADGES